MGIKINFDAAGNPIEPTFILTSHSANRLGLLTGVSEINVIDAMKENPEVTFNVTKSMTSNLWKSISDIKLIYSPEWDTWMQIHVELNDSDSTVKNVTGTGLCQAELSQINLYGLEFNTESDIERDDYERSIIYNFENPNASVLHGIMSKIPNYKIKHVDASIAKMQKTFTFDEVSVQDAFNTIADECHCLVVYNNGMNPKTNQPAREISFYDLETICNTCGHRGEFTDICPECGSTDLKYGYGKDTKIFVSKDSLSEEITYTIDIDSVKNCFKLVGGDDVMTAAIRACNPNGSDYIWYISNELKEDMPKELVKKIESYDELYEYYSKEHATVLDTTLLNDYNDLIERYKPYNEDLVKIDNPNLVGYSSLMNIIYDVIDFDAFLETSLMPIDDTKVDTTAEKEAAKLTTESLSPIALNSVSKYDEDIINQMVLSVARIIVDTRYDVKIKQSQLFINESEDEGKKHQWVGSFTITNYSDSDLTADTDNILIFINKDYDTYIRQRVEKVLADSANVEEYDISKLLKLDKPLDEFKESIKPYNIKILTNLKDTCDTCLDTLQAESIGNQSLWKDPEDGVDMYEKYYLNYYNKLEAIVAEIESKNHDQETINNLREFITAERNKIQEALNFENYLGTDLWLIFCSYRREDTYKNENFISDGLSNAELFDNAREFYETARKEIFKSATMQHSITASLKNLLAIPEFEPLRNYFEIGNWIRIEVDGEIYRLRLIKYTIDYDNLEEIDVEFSDCTKTADGITDINSLLSKTTTMATSYESIKRQATKGYETNNTVSNWFTNGLDATLTKIVDSGETQDVVIDKHGILIRDFDDVTESYWPQQMKFINKTLALTTDNWKTLVTAIGNFIYQDPVTREYVEAYGINAETVIGNLILGRELGIFNDDASLRFDENGLWIYNDTNSFRVNPNSDTLLSLAKNDEKIFWVDENGMLHIQGDGAGLDISANSSITGMQSEFKVTSDEIKASIEDTKNGLSSEISETAEAIRTEVKNTTDGLDSKIDQTASSITQTVNDYKEELESSITQTATSLETKISDTKAGLESQITQTSTEIKTLISDTESGLNSTIDQTASAIRQEVTDADNKLQASIETTAEAIRQEVTDKYNGLDSKITQTADSITSDVSSKYEGLNSKIVQQAGQIESLVKADEGLQSDINQKYNEITLSVKNLKTDTSSQITALSDRITSEVTRADTEEKKIWTKVNQTATSLEAEIKNTENMKQELNNKLTMNVDSTMSQIHALQINARNFAYGTSSEWQDVNPTGEEDVFINSHIVLRNKGVKAGNTILVHLDVKFSSDFTYGSAYLRINKNPSGSASYVYDSSLSPSAGKEAHIAFSFTATDDMLDGTLSEYLLLTANFSNCTGTFWWKNLMVEVGTTESPWLSAPEDIGTNFYDVQTELKQAKDSIVLQATRADEHEAKITLNADKIDFVVKGDKTSGFSLTENAINFTAEQINAKGLITFSGLNKDTQTKIEASVSSSVPEYYVSDSNSIAPNSNDEKWTTSVNWDNVKNDENYVWQRMKTTYGDGTISYTDPVCLSDGKEIVSVRPQYYLSSSSSSVPSNASWSYSMPTYNGYGYIWTRNYITYSNGDTRTTTPVYDSGLTRMNENIQEAVVEANGHSVYCSPSTPTGSFVEGDVWYKTDGSNQIIEIYVWQSPGNWVQHKNGTTTIANGTITTDLIAAGAITAQKFAGSELCSFNYSLDSNGKCTDGMRIDLSNGAMTTTYFSLDHLGQITATAGNIGGMSIFNDHIGTKDTGMSATGWNGVDNTGWRLWAKGGKFRVDADGITRIETLNSDGATMKVYGTVDFTNATVLLNENTGGEATDPTYGTKLKYNSSTNKLSLLNDNDSVLSSVVISSSSSSNVNGANITPNSVETTTYVKIGSYLTVANSIEAGKNASGESKFIVRKDASSGVEINSTLTVYGGVGFHGDTYIGTSSANHNLIVAGKTTTVDLTATGTVDFSNATVTGLAGVSLQIDGRTYSNNLTSYNLATHSWVTGQGYLTSHQSLSSYATIKYVDSKYAGDVVSAISGQSVKLYQITPSGTFNGEKVLPIIGSLKAEGNLSCTGDVWCTGAVHGSNISDERLKNIIFDIGNVYKDLFMQIKPIAFTWKDKNIDTKIHFGVGAQTIEKSINEFGIDSSNIGIVKHRYFDSPNENTGLSDQYYVNYDEIYMLTIPVVQEHEREIIELKKEIEELRETIRQLKTA